MEIQEIASRFAEGLVAVDISTQHISANQRNGEIYLPGVKTLRENKFVEELTQWWKQTYPMDFNPIGAIATEVPYPNISRAKCDLIFSTDGSILSNPEWSIEVKHIALVGNNGKNNDYGVAKILSPYLKDRSLIHDIYRIKNHGFSKRKAVVGYCFNYDATTCDEAERRHPNNLEFVDNLRKVCRLNNPDSSAYSVKPLLEFADEIFQSKGLVNPVQILDFQNAWRHPCGGNGSIFAWEIV